MLNPNVSVWLKIGILALCAVFAAPTILAAAPATTVTATGYLFHEVEFRPGITADLHVTAMGDLDSHDCYFILHGGGFTAEGWRPFATALGEDGCVLALDFPAHGASSLPVGMAFTDLLLDDYVTMAIAVLDRLDEDVDLEPRTIAGHSQSGVVLQMLQQRLLDQGISLKKRFGIREAILVASDFPAEVPWTFGDNGGAAAIAPFMVNDPVLGLILQIPAPAWPAFFFTNLNGVVIAGAPTPAEIEANGWVSPGEPAQAINQLLGAGIFPQRPSIDADIFSKKNKTRLRTVAYAGDGFILISDSIGLHRYLSGDDQDSCMVAVTDPETVHATHMSHPERLIAALEASERCKY